MFEISVLKATRTGAARVLALGLLAMVTALLIGLMLAPGPAHAVTLTVNSTADPGTGGCNSTECTLREAINVSNGLPTTETIEFSIPPNFNQDRIISPTRPCLRYPTGLP